MLRQTSERRLDGYKLTWLRDGRHFLLLLLIVFLVFRYLIGFSAVAGSSMEDTLQDKDIVLFLRTANNYKRGDIVALRVPSGDFYVKRVIAIAGDTVDLRDGVVYVNDQALDEPYVTTPTEAQSVNVQFPLNVEEGDVFVLGDNRPVSVDSRTFGVVNTRQVKGRLLLRLGLLYVHTVK